MWWCFVFSPLFRQNNYLCKTTLPFSFSSILSKAKERRKKKKERGAISLKGQLNFGRRDSMKKKSIYMYVYMHIYMYVIRYTMKPATCSAQSDIWCCWCSLISKQTERKQENKKKVGAAEWTTAVWNTQTKGPTKKKNTPRLFFFWRETIAVAQTGAVLLHSFGSKALFFFPFFFLALWQIEKKKKKRRLQITQIRVQFFFFFFRSTRERERQPGLVGWVDRHLLRLCRTNAVKVEGLSISSLLFFFFFQSSASVQGGCGSERWKYYSKHPKRQRRA